MYPASLKTANDKDYLRILFKPGYSVQVRELNQMQSMLQSQIDKFGRSQWNDNVAVSGGETKFVKDVQYVECSYSSTGNSTELGEALYLSYTPPGITGATEIIADVLYYELVESGTYRFYISYRSSSLNADGTNISSFPTLASLSSNSSNVSDLKIIRSGYACGIYMAAGMFFTKGSFVASPEQKIFIKLAEKDETLRGNAILTVIEKQIGWATDESLLDNAAGEPNASAPGADRYSIDLVLGFDNDDAVIDDEINPPTKIVLSAIINSLPTATVDDRTAFLDAQLAQRTFEESGNYVLDPFKITVRELLDDGSNLGRFTADNLDKAGYGINLLVGQPEKFTADAKARYSLEVDKSTAYVEGYRVVLNSKYDINATKAREFSQAPLITNTYAAIGNYVTGKFDTGSLLPNMTNVTLRFDLNVEAVGRVATLTNGQTDIYILSTEGLAIGMPVTAATGIATGTTITAIKTATNKVTLSKPATADGAYSLTFGSLTVNNKPPATCKIKTVELEKENIYRIYLYDIQMQAGVSANISQLNRLTSTGFAFTITKPLAEVSSDTAIWPLGFNAVKDVTGVNYIIRHVTSGELAANETQIPINIPAGGTIVDTSIGYTILNLGGNFNQLTGVSASGYTVTPSAVKRPYTAITPIFMRGDGNNGENAFAKTLSPGFKSFTQGGIIGIKEFTLPHADVFKLTGVSFKADAADTTEIDILSDCTISDDGQRSNYYTNVKVKYNGNKTFVSANVISFTYSYLNRNGKTLNGFATVNSYYSSDNEAGGLTYDTIPSFNGVRLSDVIDFRPIILDVGTDTINAKQQIDPGSALLSTSTIYLPRIDKLVVATDAKFTIESGIPSLNPVEPKTPANSMALYTLDIPAYTYKASDIKTNYIDNRRYTMRDIGQLESRITSLEEYTELSKLENVAQNKVITDILGARFKNAVLTDGFLNHNTGDIFNAAYNCSIDPAEGIARPAFSTNSVRLKRNSNTSGISIGENLVTLAYDDVVLINQPYASSYESVNPYEVITYNGNIEISPSTDEWKDTKRVDFVVDRIDTAAYNDAVKNTIVGTVWNNWTTTWTGQPVVVRSAAHSVWWPERGFKARTTTTTNTTVQKRTGKTTTLTYTDIVERKDARIIDVSFIPFMRSRKVYFRARRLKPKTRVYPFFDGIDISSYTMATPFVRFTNSTEVRDYTGFFPEANVGYGSPLITNEYGEVEGMFLVPNNNSLKFKVGSRLFKLTDNERNIDADQTTFAQGEYTATGISETLQTSIVTTRIPQVNTINVSDSRTLVDAKVTWDDPLAQSFMLSNIPTGAYITSIDLYFQAISKTSPVSIHIVTMENGYPTQEIVPFTQVTRNPYPIGVTPTDQNNLIPFDAVAAAKVANFKFSDPVYLKANVEYAIVIMSNDPAYKVWVADSNGFDVSTTPNKPINKNVYAGVFFKSQNGSTWSADQTRDLKFKIYRAQFKPEGSVVFKPVLDDGVSSITVLPQTGTTNTGFSQSATVKLALPYAGSSGGTKPIYDEIPGVYERATASLTVDTLTGAVIAVNITKRGKGYGSGDTAAWFNNNTTWTRDGTTQNNSLLNKFTCFLDSASMTTFSVVQSNLNIPGTTIENELQLGIDTNKIVSLIDVYENYDLNSVYTINRASAPNTTLKTSLTTTNDYVSPVIDTERVSLLAIKNEVNDLLSNDVSEINNDAGAATSRYLTRLITLDNPANQLNVYLDINRPSSSAGIAVYVKLVYDGDADIPTSWTLATPTNPLPVSSSYTDFAESEYVITSPGNDFLAFAVKIVFLSSNTYDIASIANLKVIATTGLL